jgi:phosphoribosylformimino-5-aminoimidazole carboxamide ribotide isomerase
VRVIPVLDLLDSVVVRGVAGRRDEYRPVESSIAVSAAPIDVARAFRDHFGLTTLYVADLDAILHGELNQDAMQDLADDGFELLVDAGARNAADADLVLAAGATKVIIGLETWPLLSSLELLTRRVGPEQLIFSLDLKSGELVRTFNDLLNDDPMDVAAAVLEAGVHELIVLDVAAVGTGSGISTLPLCRSILDFAPRSRVITGGGVRTADDLKTLHENELHGALVASALHDGSISADEIRFQ